VFVGLCLFLITYSCLYYYFETKAPRIDPIDIGGSKEKEDNLLNEYQEAEKEVNAINREQIQ
jgi:hypothetical protein